MTRRPAVSPLPSNTNISSMSDAKPSSRPPHLPSAAMQSRAGPPSAPAAVTAARGSPWTASSSAVQKRAVASTMTSARSVSSAENWPNAGMWPRIWRISTRNISRSLNAFSRSPRHASPLPDRGPRPARRPAPPQAAPGSCRTPARPRPARPGRDWRTASAGSRPTGNR